MAAKKTTTRSVPRREYLGRWKNAQERRAAMERELASDLLDPALVLAVQAAIAAADAFCIYHRGERSAADRHFDALTVLSRVAGVPGVDEARKHLARLLERKAAIEYSGGAPRKAEAEVLVEHARRFIDFVAQHLPAEK